ncbi:BatD family protein [Colwellia psychrerythraea]|uniref:Aerotolerance-related protein BatD n=1 Tax=Colwellia psychrerythraea TaxID=28229 RepID=A0A099KWC9_COLPS|nr:BatD family protein [Colwellia psychrerythraea]KGJ94132.1 Aerotolerance-related protein BatD [Colwellia psychrerythraea]
MRPNNLLAKLISAILLITHFATAAQENSLAKLQSQGKFKIAVSIANTDNSGNTSLNLVPNQQVNLIVELYSIHPFNDNYTLPYFDVDNAVVNPPGDKAILEIKTIDEQQWFVQRKEISIYPLKEGRFSIPSLTATAFVKLDNQQVVSGTITSKAINFTVYLPVELQGVKNFVASSNVSFTLKQSGTKKDAQNNEVQSQSIGSAITYTYTLKADNMHVIMLDKLTMPKIEGIQVYQKPAIEKDVFDRFEKFNTAELTHSFTFIFQQEGEFIIPGQRITWWDLANNKLKEININAQKFTVGKAASGSGDNTAVQGETFVDSIKSLWTNLLKGKLADNNTIIYSIILLVVIIFCVAVIRTIVLHRNVLLDSFHEVNKTRQKQLVRDFSHRVSDKNYKEALNCLYKLAKLLSGSTTSLSALINTDDVHNQVRLQNLQTLAFKSELTPTVSITAHDAEMLLASLLKKQARCKKRQGFKFSSTLNP